MVDRYLGPPNQERLSRVADVDRISSAKYTGYRKARDRMEDRARYADPGRRLDLDANKLTGLSLIHI